MHTRLTPTGTLPRLTRARAGLTRAIEGVNQLGETVSLAIPVERALTVYVDKRELVTLMTLGAHPELLVLGFLRNQRLVETAQELASITVDWDTGAAAVRTHKGITRLRERTARHVVTTGCGQGSVFGQLMEDVHTLVLPEAVLHQRDLYAIVDTIRLADSIYKAAGSVHGCALFRGSEMLVFVEDVGRHNAIDTIAGWMWMQDVALQSGHDKVFYTTGRLTSEMVIKAAQMGVPIVISRSGTTEMGLQVARKLGLCTVGRATHKHFICYSAPHRLSWQPSLAEPRLRAVA
jgi:FdhD protein